MEQGYLIRADVSGRLEKTAVLREVPEETLCTLLNTDVYERMRISVVPENLESQGFVLCYFIDARGGDKQLPSNTL